jgi:sugar/nucleoside kinase (ribokinase family)
VQPPITTFGNVAIDDLVYADGTTRWAVPGGGAVYAALGAALWTGRARVAAPFGLDFPRASFPQLEFTGRRVQYTMRHWGLYEQDGYRHFVSRRASLHWEDFSSTVEEIGDATHAHIAPMPFDYIHELVRELRPRCGIISVDPHDRKSEISRDILFITLESVDIFVPSLQDVAELLGTSSPTDALASLRHALPEVMVLGVKCGAAGAFVHQRGATHGLFVPPASDQVVDETGAGDAFCGGLLAGYVATHDLREAAVRGAVSASFTIAGFGPEAIARTSYETAEVRAAALRPRVEAFALR